jgi:hypothetical protein
MPVIHISAHSKTAINMKENTPLASLIRNEQRTLAVFQFFFTVLLLLTILSITFSDCKTPQQQQPSAITIKKSYSVDYSHCFLVIDTTKLAGLKEMNAIIAQRDLKKMKNMVKKDLLTRKKDFESIDYFRYIKIVFPDYLYYGHLHIAKNNNMDKGILKDSDFLNSFLKKGDLESYSNAAGYFMYDYTFMKLDAINGDIWPIHPWYVWPDEYDSVFMSVLESYKKSLNKVNFLFTYYNPAKVEDEEDEGSIRDTYLIPRAVLLEIESELKLRKNNFEDPILYAKILEIVSIGLAPNNCLLYQYEP